ncbi:PhzF family phenazine biosynthesis protein [Neolewinella lacunae]|uniref:PhzF family phenazine biosynthesis protein n=1 Tax=Neolewinella lacunae TaxID=1517758 RepID=A0A923TAK6_9BACT|nr:PhzF family phenazine biosynthesis protein [Neolewinella lacunae]MBC6996579.1 PhzF family phenazine biosynthesis protein [Neolewinella lacunae]MDN3634857.1 PhzF family phenazine biosynthesis protein [Neolewinella lacunae]
MHNLPLYQVDAFTSKLFGGNPAAVVPVPAFPSEALMQSIASENNLSETAFVVVKGPGRFDIRWFTPVMEVRLCGHATLAAAHVMHQASGGGTEKMRFRTRKAGTIVVTPQGPGSFTMEFAADQPEKARHPKGLKDILRGQKAEEVWRGTDDLIVVLKNQKAVERCRPDFARLAALKKYRGLLLTAPGKEHDFVSRGFFPAYGINEDPVTGSAHTLLTPFWAARLGKNTLTARQVSQRGGELTCSLHGKKVRLTGQAVTYLSGQLHLEGE